MLARIAALMRDARLRQRLVEAPDAAHAIRALFVQAEDAYLAGQTRPEASQHASAP